MIRLIRAVFECGKRRQQADELLARHKADVTPVIKAAQKRATAAQELLSRLQKDATQWPR